MRKQSRRSFFAAAASAAAAAGTVDAAGASTHSKSTVELLNIGVIALGDYSHLGSDLWSPMINPVPGKEWYGRTTGMKITHCWDRDPEIAAAYAREYGCEAVKHYDDMVGKVDGMIFGGFYEAKWWPQLARPYLEAGIPCYLNRPFAYSMKDATDIIETARTHNTPVLSMDSMETFKVSVTARGKVEQLIRDGKTILGVNSDNSAYEYPAHAIHGIYFLLSVFGLDVGQVSFQADGWWDGVSATSSKKMEYGLLTLQYNGIDIPGVGRQDKKFMIAQQAIAGYASNAGMRIYHDGGWWDIDDHWTISDKKMRWHSLFFPVILQMQKMFETGVMPQSYEYQLQKTRVFLAGFKSHLEHNGALVNVNDLPDDWVAPTPRPDWINSTMFDS